ncbi:MAG: hypothetical protein FWC79_05350 [Oscillospiraceae bacterium]|nr:hypothetical protein [Oscillospiraceae bacterium]
MKKRFKILFVIILSMIVGLILSDVHANTETVSTATELRDALNNPSVSVILLQGGEFLVTQSFNIGRPLTINTVDDANATIRRQGASTNIFNVLDVAGANLTIENGEGGGSIVVSGSNSPGIGIHLRGPNANATIGNGVSITQFGNSAVRAPQGGNFTMNGTARIHNNSTAETTTGGGVFLNNGATFTMNGGSIDNNRSYGSGGGVIVDNGSTFTMYNGTINNNVADNWGGGVRFHNGSIVRMYNGIVTENISHRGGGGFAGSGTEANVGRLYIMNGTVSNNTVTDLGRNEGTSFGGGGGIFADGTAVVTVSSGRIYGNATSNSVVGRGAGVFLNQAATFNLSGDAIIENNTETPRGGGIHVNSPNNRLNITGGIIRNNEATNGGGIYLLDGRMYIDNGLIYGNNAIENGGGIFYHQEARARINSGTIEGNSAENGGGLFVEHNDDNIPRLTIEQEVIFRNNFARAGRFVNNAVAAANPQVRPGTITVVPHAFSNYDINVRGGHQVAIITFKVRNGVGGTLAGEGVTVTGDEIGKIALPLGEYVDLTATPFANFSIAGWFVDDGPQLQNINELLPVENMHIEVLYIANIGIEDENNDGVTKGEQHQEEGPGNAMQTGDGTRIGMYVILVIVAMSGILLSLRHRRNKRGRRYS